MQVAARSAPTTTLQDRFVASLEAFLLQHSPSFAVALSGGADSLALTLLAHEWAIAHGGRMVAITVDHGLRAESHDEAQQVAAWMRARGITHHILTPPHRAVSNNPQEEARAWRYDALADFCAQHGLLHCLIAHNAGDNRETVALHTTRGDTADGGSGMARVRNYQGVRFVRPLLEIERHELEDFLRSIGAAWIEDPSNRNPRFARVRVRQALADDAAQRAMLDATIRRESAARTQRDDALAAAAIRCVTLHPLGFADINLVAWCALEPLLASQLIADCITTIGGAIQRPRGHETARLVTALDAPFRKRTLQHCEITLVGDRLRIAREVARVAAPMKLSGSGTAMWDKRFRVRYDLPAGITYTLAALGARGRKQLGRGNILPLATPALWHLDEVVFVPHMGMAGPAAQQVRVGFAPPKALAAAPFW